MELRYIRYFVAVAEAGSFRKAAEDLHVAQPALTRQISKLERELGVSLFETGSRRRQLNAAGKLFLEEANSILASVDRGIHRVREAGRKKQITLRIAYTEVASYDPEFARLIAKLRQAGPVSGVELLPMTSWHQLEALKRGRIDAGCLWWVSDMDRHLSVRHMSDHVMMAVLPKNSPLSRKTKLHLRDLDGARLIFVSRSVRSDLYQSVVEGFRAAASPVPEIEEVGSSSTVTSLVSVGMGVGLLMSAMKPQLPEGLVMRRIVDLSIKYCLVFAWYPAIKSAAVSAITAVAQEVAEAAPEAV